MPSNIDISILMNAIDENTNIFIRKEKGRDEYSYYSRFLSYNRERKEIIIDLPSLSRDSETLKKNDRIEIFFSYRNFRLVFDTAIKGKTQYNLRKNRLVSALIISFPTELQDGEKRNFFRVPTPPIKVEVVPDPKNPDLKESDCSYFANIYEIAGGGAGIREDRYPIPIMVGDQVQVRIHFEERIMEMDARVRYKRLPKDATKQIYGLEFNQEAKNPRKFKQNVRAILRYVMKRQRELLQ